MSEGPRRTLIALRPGSCARAVAARKKRKRTTTTALVRFQGFVIITTNFERKECVKKGELWYPGLRVNLGSKVLDRGFSHRPKVRKARKITETRRKSFR